MKLRSFVPALGSLLFLGAPLAHAATSGNNGTHDPSRLVESNGKFYFYSTGGSGKSSADGLSWEAGAAIFPNGFPAWVKQLIPNDQGLWAPDLIHLNDKYYLYYSVAGDKRTCLIGLATTPTLDPNAPGYAWKDEGLVVKNDEVVKYAAIDAAPFLDADQNLWVVWGGGYANPNDADAIWVTRLDNSTGLPSSDDAAKPGHPLLKGHKEGPYIHYHDGSYFLFWQTGGCCSGYDSTYTIHMARSSSVTGPYTGDRVLLGNVEGAHGPGHIGIYDKCGEQRFTYHYYPPSGRSVLGEKELSWGADGWPVAGADSTKPLAPCEGNPPTGGGGAGGGGAGAGGAAGNGGSGGASGGAEIGGFSNPGGSPPTTSAGSAGMAMGGTPTTGGSTSTGGSAPTAGSTVDNNDETSESSSCHFAAPGRKAPAGALPALLGLALLAGRRKRR